MKTGAVDVKANVGVGHAAAGLEVQSVQSVTWFYFNESDVNDKFELLRPKSQRLKHKSNSHRFF